jgi:sortase A
MDLPLTSGHGAVNRASRAAVALAASVTMVLASAPAESAAARTVTGRATQTASTTAAKVEFSSGRPRDARLTIPAIGIHRLRVIAYRGKTDDAPGTRIQNRGIAASPYGRHGGTGPGGLGNYQVTAHRTSHGGVFRHTPSVHRGARLLVDAGRWRYVYRVVKTRWVSFRSATSLRKQRAAVPGRPGQKPTRGYITISTCATPEDHARGNYWTDRFGNPEHRIDKIGVLRNRVRNPHWHRTHR